MHRRSIRGVALPAALLAALLAAGPGAPGAATALAATATPVIALDRIAGGHTFSQPVLLTNAGDSRLFVVERAGRIRIVKDGSVLASPFLDITARVRSSFQEEGLLGLAFHPGYPADPRFYVAYTKPDLSLQVSAFSVSANPDVASATETPIIDVPHPTNENHNGGMLAFGPDGDLYVGTGDGGSGGDPPNNAQNLGVLLGKILRLDVDHPAGGRAYGIPADNPYAGIPGRKGEIWSFGLRNPWRFSFDRSTHDLWIADVGQNAYEEVDRATAAGGLGKAANYGWSCREGFHVYDASRCPSSGLVSPYAEYAHGSGDSTGCAVTGGYVYRGSAYPTLQGLYLFGDYCSGRIWDVPAGGGSPQAPQQLLDTSLNISAFGEDAAGELYVVDLDGGIYHVTAPVSRIAGADRYGTSAAIAATYASASTVYVASGANFPDALAAAPVAGRDGVPLLLVAPGSVPSAVAAQLARLRPASIVVLGGTSAVSAGVATQLAAYLAPGGSVTRIAGTDRYDTAARISRASFASGAATVFVATGQDYPDALSVAALAGMRGAPLLLVPGSSPQPCSATGAPVPCPVEAELARLAPASIVVAGGAAAVSDAIVGWLGGETTPTGQVTRLAGADRYATSAAIGAQFPTSPPAAYAATGQNFPDALSGAALAGSAGAPLVLVRPTSVPAPIGTLLAGLRPHSLVVLGGSAAVSDATARALGAYAVP